MKRFQDCKKVKKLEKKAIIDGKEIILHPYDFTDCPKCSDFNNCNAKTNLKAEKSAWNSMKKDW